MTFNQQFKPRGSLLEMQGSLSMQHMQRRKHVVSPFVQSQFCPGPVDKARKGYILCAQASRGSDRRALGRSYLVLAMTVSRLSSSEQEISPLRLGLAYMYGSAHLSVWRTRSSLAAVFRTATPAKRSHPSD